MAQKQKRKPYIPIVIAGLLFAAVVATIYFLFFNFSVPNLPKPALKDLAASHNIELGDLVKLNNLRTKAYSEIVDKQYSFVTSDYEAHWLRFRPSATKYNFAKLDMFVNYAKANGKPVQLHHLIWGEDDSLPNWLKNSHYNSDQLLDILHDHITNTVSHYKGEIAEWSVVNEAFLRSQHVYGLHDWWADHISNGTQYIDDAFIWAHQADPKTKLILNDSENEIENNVSDAMYSYIKDARARGVPIDGIGMQMHINATKPPTKDDVIKNIKRFGAIGVSTYITEFDVNLDSVQSNDEYKSQLESQIVYNMVRACVESKTCVSFDEFGLTDKRKGILGLLSNHNSRSYLFDGGYNPKPSFYAFRKAWSEP